MQGQFAYDPKEGQPFAMALSQFENKNKSNPFVSRTANGQDFLQYKQPAYHFTDYSPAGLTNSAYSLQRNSPTDAVMANNAMQMDGNAQATRQNYAMAFNAATIKTQASNPIMCTSPNTPCEFPAGSVCAAVNIDWDDAKGNQTNFCSTAIYPELKNGVYNRLSAVEGGLGKSCTRDGDCAGNKGYFCNNETNVFGKNRQQTGFCSQKYTCPDGKTLFAGYPYNASAPMAPAPEQNNYGKGYGSKDECSANLQGYQNCAQGNNGRFYAVFTQYCPVKSTLRQGNSPVGQFTSTPSTQSAIEFPGVLGQGPSYISGPTPGTGQFSAFNTDAQDTSPLMWSLSANPRPR